MTDFLNLGLQSPPNSLEPTNILGASKSKRKVTDGGRFTSIGLPQSEDTTPLVQTPKRKPRHRANKYIPGSKGIPNPDYQAAPTPKYEPGTKGLPEFQPGQAPVESLTDRDLAELHGGSATLNIPSYNTLTPEYKAKEDKSIRDALDAGWSPLRIQRHVVKLRNEEGYNPVEVPDGRPIDPAILQPVPTMVGVTPNQIESAREAIARLDNIYSRHGTNFLWLGGFASDAVQEEYLEKYNAEVEAMTKSMIAQGFNTYYDERADDIKVVDTEGKSHSLNVGIIKSIEAAAGETTGSIGGMLTGGVIGGITAARVASGAVTGATKGAAAGSFLGPVGTAGGAAAGGIIGGLIGAGAGAGADYLINTYLSNQNTKADIGWGKMIDAGLADVAYGAMGSAGFKAAGVPYKWAKGHLVRAWDVLQSGGEKEALAYIQKHFNIDDDQAKKITTDWLATLQDPDNLTVEPIGIRGLLPFSKDVPMSEGQKQMAAIVLTRPGGEDVTSALKNLGPNHIRNNADNIAKQLKPAVETLIKENNEIKDTTGVLIKDNDGIKDGVRRVHDDIQEYRRRVVDTRKAVEEVPAELIDPTDFRFDLKEHTTDITKAYLNHNMARPESFKAFSNLVDSLEAGESIKNFSNLLQLRNLAYKFKGEGARPDDKHFQTAMDLAIGRIDKTLKEAIESKTSKELANTWSESHELVLKEEHDMITHKENLLTKAILAPGQSEQDIADSIIKYLPSVDKTSKDFLSKLSDNSRSRVEGLFMRGEVEKHTVAVQGFEAINFRGLVKDLDRYNFNDPNAIALKEAIENFSSTMGNDVALSGGSNTLTDQQLMNALTLNPFTKAQYAASSKLFTRMMQFLPTKRAEIHSALYNMHRVLENPYDRKAVDNLIELKVLDPRNDVAKALGNAEDNLRNLATEYDLNSVSSGSLLRNFEDNTGVDRVGIYSSRVQEVDAYIVRPKPEAPKKAELPYSSKVLKKNTEGVEPIEGRLGKGYYTKASITDADRTKFERTEVLSKSIQKSKLANYNTINTLMYEKSSDKGPITFARMATDKALRDRVNKVLKKEGYEGIINSNDNTIMLFDLKE